MDSQMKKQSDWKKGDVWLALLLLGIGALVLFFGYSLWQNDWHVLIAGLCFVPGVVFLLLGANGVFRSLSSSQS